jgi:hypothetical protein
MITGIGASNLAVTPEAAATATGADVREFPQKAQNVASGSFELLQARQIKGQAPFLWMEGICLLLKEVRAIPLPGRENTSTLD